ncbi:aspartyl protease family protein [Sphingobacterium sp. MYb388]|uniref:aspartyl protease family protein n=1 Tax=Sphingobacterium sp. MYb388 TaxID=2745437 RepID=UPI0030AC95ED
MRKKIIAVLILYAALIGFCHAQEKAVQADIQKIIVLLNNKNSIGLLKMMADSCTIGNLPSTIDKQRILPDILANFQGVDTYEWITDSVMASGDHFVSLLINYRNGGRGKPTFVFNKDGKMVELGIIKVKLTANPTQALAAALSNTIMPDTMRVKFKLINDLIYVPAILNGIDGFFMFDSGAASIMLRKKYVPEHAINKDVNLDFTGMGGSMSDVNWSTGNHLIWGEMVINSLDAPAVSMAEMDQEELVVGPLFGLMGFGIFSAFQLSIDYDKHELLLERVDRAGHLAGLTFKHGKPLATIPIKMRRHIPIIDLNIGGRSYPMGIDCGANTNLLKNEVVHELMPYLRFEGKTTSLLGVGNSQTKSEVAHLEEAHIDSLSLTPMSTVITEQAIGAGKGDQQLPMVGLLGTPFLKQFKMVFNFQKGNLYLY